MSNLIDCQLAVSRLSRIANRDDWLGSYLTWVVFIDEWVDKLIKGNRPAIYHTLG